MYARKKKNTVRRPRRRYPQNRYAPIRAYKPKATRPRKASPPKEPTWAPAVGSALGGALGSMVAPGIGTSIGSALGSAAGNLFHTITGHGDYDIKSNSLMMSAEPVPSFGKNRLVVKNREYVFDLSSSAVAGAFYNQSFPLNPGLQNGLFPWLSGIAQNYEQYRWLGLTIEFVSTSADALNSTNTALGKVIMATEYNAENPAWTNQQQMMASLFSNQGKPSCNLLHAVECDRSEQPTQFLYVRGGAIPSGADARLYDHGNFQIATVGMQAASVNLGAIWVSYEVEFLKPILPEALGTDLLTDHYQLTNPAVAGSAYFGSSRTLVAGSQAGTQVSGSQVGFNSITQSGTYLVTYNVAGTSAAVAAPTFTGTNCTALTVWSNTTGFDKVSGMNNGSTTSAYFIQMWLVSITGPSASFALSGGTLPSGTTYGDLWITQVNGNITS